MSQSKILYLFCSCSSLSVKCGLCGRLPPPHTLPECSSACFVGLSVFAAMPTAQVFSSSHSSGALWLLVPQQDRLACFLKLLKSHGTVTCEEWCTLSPSPGLWAPSRQMALSPPPPTLTLPHIPFRSFQRSFNTSWRCKTYAKHINYLEIVINFTLPWTDL